VYALSTTLAAGKFTSLVLLNPLTAQARQLWLTCVNVMHAVVPPYQLLQATHRQQHRCTACWLLFRFAAPDGQRLMLFLDDINLPAKEQYGAQPPLELLRSLQDKGGMYDRCVPQPGRCMHQHSVSSLRRQHACTTAASTHCRRWPGILVTCECKQSVWCCLWTQHNWLLIDSIFHALLVQEDLAVEGSVKCAAAGGLRATRRRAAGDVCAYHPPVHVAGGGASR
jgi:hypothetical protein